MRKVFNVSGDCKPERHYMVNIKGRLEEIREMVVRGDYFTVNRARQYGKTTTLKALGKFLQKEYVVLNLDFQKLSHGDFETESGFVQALAREILKKPVFKTEVPEDMVNQMRFFVNGEDKKVKLAALFECFSSWCGKSDKPVVLMIDEVDSAANNQVFMDFLAQMRGYYLDREETPFFQSVILAGVYDVKNLKRKLAAEEEHKVNSPWNIAADFLVDMSFSVEDIAGMLREYEADYGTGMNIDEAAEVVFDYTSGYPFLVSRVCKLVDERVARSEKYPDRSSAWTQAGIVEAVKLLLTEQNTLFESLVNKLEDYPELEDMLRDLLFNGKEIPYAVGVKSVEMALMFGFVKKTDNKVVIANRIFETLLYNLFLTSPAVQKDQMYNEALRDKNQFIQEGHLDMKRVLERFVVHFDELYGDKRQSFVEEDGRRYFLLYLRPIINGEGNYYIEARTRNMERTDVIIDYGGEQYIVELKIWRGNAYNERGEKQLTDYLDHYHLEKGYMLSFNFNKKKKIGVEEIQIGNKILVEAVV